MPKGTPTPTRKQRLREQELLAEQVREERALAEHTRQQARETARRERLAAAVEVAQAFRTQGVSADAAFESLRLSSKDSRLAGEAIAQAYEPVPVTEDMRASLERGLAQAAAGDTIEMSPGSFIEYVGEDADD